MAYFEQQLAKTAGIGFLKPEPRITTLAPYGFVLKYFAEQVKGHSSRRICGGSATGGHPCDGLFYEPVYRSSLFPLDPADFPALSWGRSQPLDLKTMYTCPESEKAAYREAVWFPHQIFLGPRSDIDAIVEAMHKVLKNIENLRDLDHKAIRNQRLSRADRES